MEPYPRREARFRAMPVILHERPDASAHRTMVDFLNDFGFEWSEFHSKHEPTPPMTSTEHAYLLARDITHAAQHLTALLPYFAAHLRWNRMGSPLPAEQATKDVFTILSKDHHLHSVCGPEAEKSPVHFFLIKILRKWCVANMPWRECDVLPDGDGQFRLRMPNPHDDKLRNLRSRAAECLVAYRRAVPRERRLVIERPAIWNETYIPRVFPIAPEAWRPHLEAFLWKYQVDLVEMLYLENDEDFPRPPKKVAFTPARAMRDMERMAEACARMANADRNCVIFSGGRHGYTHLRKGDPPCLYIANSNFPLPLKATNEGKVFTVPYAAYLAEAGISGCAPGYTNRRETGQFNAFWKAVVRRCGRNDAIVVVEGEEIHELAICDVRTPPAVVREAAADVQALADALRRALPAGDSGGDVEPREEESGEESDDD
jgi:hypothetical protein